MSWASRRRLLYTTGILLFLGLVFGIPAAIWWHEPPSCFDGKLNQEETATDKGGPCILIDERALTPYSVLWSRAFPVRDGAYNVAAYIENPNSDASVRSVRYIFKLYDDKNVVVAERIGRTFIMPGGITPVFEGSIDTGNRAVLRTFFEFIEAPIWERLSDVSSVIVISNKTVTTPGISPRITARVENTSVAPILEPGFVAVVFDTAGNAFAASQTTLPRLDPGETREIVFTWFAPFEKAVGRIDILPVVPPVER